LSEQGIRIASGPLTNSRRSSRFSCLSVESAHYPFLDLTV
jgi:hypothetical protein